MKNGGQSFLLQRILVTCSCQVPQFGMLPLIQKRLVASILMLLFCFIVPYRDVPKYNPKRRGLISRAYSDLRITGTGGSGSRRSVVSLGGAPLSRNRERSMSGPPSPCPSNRSLPPFSSASSSMSECSSSTNQTHSHTSSSSYSESSYSEGSQFGSEDNCGSAVTGYFILLHYFIYTIPLL